MKKRYNISIDEDVKAAFEEEVADMGISMSSAIEIFMRAVISQHRIPFSVGTYDHAFVELPPVASDAASALEPKPAPEPTPAAKSTEKTTAKAERSVSRNGKKGKKKKK